MRKIVMSCKDLAVDAEISFMRISGFRKDIPLHREMHSKSVKLWESVVGLQHIQVVYHVLPWDNTFDCRLLERIPREKVNCMVAYAVTIGEDMPDNKMDTMDRLYWDMWGTAYIEAALHCLKDMLKSEFHSHFTIGPFGPGYFGMPMSETGKMLETAHGEEIGITLLDGGNMSPSKSCTGLFLIVNSNVEIPSECESCIGNNISCEFCSVGKN